MIFLVDSFEVMYYYPRHLAAEPGWLWGGMLTNEATWIFLIGAMLIPLAIQGGCAHLIMFIERSRLYPEHVVEYPDRATAWYLPKPRPGKIRSTWYRFGGAVLAYAVYSLSLLVPELSQQVAYVTPFRTLTNFNQTVAESLYICVASCLTIALAFWALKPFRQRNLHTIETGVKATRIASLSVIGPIFFHLMFRVPA